MTENDSFRPNHRVLDAFVAWIEQPCFDRQHARNWAHLYNADPEAAMCEATFWAVLADCGVVLEPNADLTGRKAAPDFRCRKGSQTFYVEVTCIQTRTATRKTSLDPTPADGAGEFGHLNDAIVEECRKKTPQCANLDAPCLLAVGTFHFQASTLAVQALFMEWLLTGETAIGWDFDPQLGRGVGDPYQVTSFRSASFSRLSKLVGVEHIRHPISALLVGGLGCEPPRLFRITASEPRS